MTPKPQPCPCQKSKKLHMGQYIFMFLSLFCFCLTYRNPALAISHMEGGLILCVDTIIPSLFPFMVLSDILVSSGIGAVLGRFFTKPMQGIFGVSGAGSCAVVLGSLCGFPVGASVAVSLYDQKLISKRECEHLLTFVNQPSSAYITMAVGVGMFGSRRLGVVMYGVILGCGFLVGFLARFFMRENKQKIVLEPRKHPLPSPQNMGEMLTSAVANSALRMLTVCGYVVFFSALVGVMREGVMSHLPMGDAPLGKVISALFWGGMEISGGMRAAASLAKDLMFGGYAMGLAWVVCGMIGGWSGISAHCQILSLCGGRGISLRPYLCAKMLQCVLCGLVMWGVWRFCPAEWFMANASTMVGEILDISVGFKTPMLPKVVSLVGMVVGVGEIWVKKNRG